MKNVNSSKYSKISLVSDLVAKYFYGIGIERIYGAPGTSELSLLHSASRFGIKYFFTLHDTVAVGMADGFARANNSIAVVNLHATQGLLNAAGFIRVALRDNTPLLIIAGLPSTTYDIYEPNHFNLNLQQAITPITKWGWTVSNTDMIVNVLNRAISMALSPPRGPAFVCIPQDFMEKDIPANAEEVEPIIPVLDIRNLAARETIEQAVAILANAQNPTIFAGHGSQNAVHWVETLADLIAAPIISESLDRGPQVQNVYCRTLHPLSLGFFDIREPKIKEQIAKSDALLFIGSRATYAKIIGCLPEKCTVIEVNTNPAEVGKYHRVDIPLVGNIQLTLEKLCHHTRIEIENRNLSGILSDRKQSLVEKISDYKREKNEKLAAVSMKNGPITGIQLIKAMRESLPRNAVIVDDSQCMGYYLKHYYDFHEPHTLYGSMASHIGWGVPAALGIKQAKMSKIVVALVGDGSFMFGLQAVAAASTHNIPVLIIIANNQGFSSLKKEIAVKWGSNPGILRNLSLDKPGFDYAQLSRSMGVKGIRVSEASHLNQGIKEGLDIVTKEHRAFVLDVVMSQALENWDESWYV
jgi:thiamine pyrophosphate-dependent acetolactate synthase large subunit-like protein